MPPRLAPADPDPFRRLAAIMERLLDPDGCPWDREQTHESLKPYVIEEAYEVCEAVDSGDPDALREELGDLALQVVFHAALARRAGQFDIDDVLSGICEKLVRRHPHVFGDLDIKGSDAVLRNWERIKREEKAKKALAKSESQDAAAASSPSASAAELPPPRPPLSALDGVPRAMPALTRATRLQEKAARVGFDWDKIDDVWNKVEEEVGELREASASLSPEAVADEFGDLLFALANVARFLKIHPEEALQATANKFIRRFHHIEARAREQGRDLTSMTLAEMDAFWDEAKRKEKHPE